MMIEKAIKVIKSCETEEHLYTALKFTKIVIYEIENNEYVYWISKHWPKCKQAFEERIHELTARGGNCWRFKKWGMVALV